MALPLDCIIFILSHSWINLPTLVWQDSSRSCISLVRSSNWYSIFSCMLASSYAKHTNFVWTEPQSNFRLYNNYHWKTLKDMIDLKSDLLNVSDFVLVKFGEVVDLLLQPLASVVFLVQGLPVEDRLGIELALKWNGNVLPILKRKENNKYQLRAWWHWWDNNLDAHT